MPYQSDATVKHKRPAEKRHIKVLYSCDPYTRAHSSCADLRSEESPGLCLVYSSTTGAFLYSQEGYTWEQLKQLRGSRN